LKYHTNLTTLLATPIVFEINNYFITFVLIVSQFIGIYSPSKIFSFLIEEYIFTITTIPHYISDLFG